MSTRRLRLFVAVPLVVLLFLGLVVLGRNSVTASHTTVTAYFENSNGLYQGDDVRILGVRVGKIEKIEPQPQDVKITFWVDDKYKLPASARAVVLAPTLVTARYIQLTPAFTGGPQMRDHAVIPRDRTAVPVEFDDLRVALSKLNQTLQPTQPGGVSTLGAFVDTVANNLRGQGSSIRDTVIKLSQALSIVGDHSSDIFGTIKNLSVFVSALQDSTDLMRVLNQNLAAVTALLSNDPNEIGSAVADLNTAAEDVRKFVADNREPLGTTSDKLAEILKATGDSIDELKQALHVFPTAIANYTNIYQPAHGSVTANLAGTNFSNPINFMCGAIQAASRLNAEQSAKLCVQYLAPIFKNRQYNYLLPLGFNLPVGPSARPNEITFSEDWLRPDFVPPAAPDTAQPPPDAQPAASDAAEPLPAEAPSAGPTGSLTANTNPAAGLPGLMVPPGGGQ